MLRRNSKDSFVGILLRASPALLLCKQGAGGGGRGDQSLENRQEVGVVEHGFCVSTCVKNINKCTLLLMDLYKYQDNFPAAMKKNTGFFKGIN